MSSAAPHTLEPRPETLADPRVKAFARLVEIVDRLRAPDGCPWDRKQTVDTMAPHLVEEAHEAVEAIETKKDGATAEELGDLLMVVALIAKIAEEGGRFDLATVGRAVSDKLIRRHPHVFGEVHVDGAEQVLANWEAIKKQEREGKEEDASALAGVPTNLPALHRAARLCGKAVSAGFRWSDVGGAVEKLVEEQRELAEALAASGLDRDAKAPATKEQRAHVEHELGDVLLAAAFLAQYLDVDPERVGREAARRFEGRFRAMERALGRPMKDLPLVELVAAWQRAKREHAGSERR
ncbi:MAG: nucleoside triphosphate pyrophosphohydrolase [Planctomycetes bacterium]|nr:nucleoside triphosphate pyrophosphohydrolase [Planctomycetota bacterium]